MKLKIVITGRNRSVARDVGGHLEKDRGYMTLRCDPSKTALFDLVLAELPHVIIICLGNETEETVKVYDILKEVVRRDSCTIIVVTNNEDEKLFMKCSELERVFFISRPVSLFALYIKMQSIEEEFEKKIEQGTSVFREYINENAKKRIRRKNVLVVDDDVEQLTLIKEQLEEFYDVSLVRSGDTAMKFLLKRKPDIILLDYLMPEKDGPQVLREIWAIEDYTDIPVMFLTGVTEKSAVLQTILELRPQGYIVKPAKKSELVAKIIDTLG